MRKLFYAIGIVASTLLLSCKGEEGKIGPSGTNGTNGTNGNANVTTYDYSSGINRFLTKSNNNYYFGSFDVPRLTVKYFNYGFILIYYKTYFLNKMELLTAKDITFPNWSNRISFSVGKVDIDCYFDGNNNTNSNDRPFLYASDVNLRVVMIEGNSNSNARKETPNIDFKDYEAVKKYYNIVE